MFGFNTDAVVLFPEVQVNYDVRASFLSASAQY